MTNPNYKPILFNPQPLKAPKPEPTPTPTLYDRYLALATNITRVKTTPTAAARTHLPMKICLYCGSLYRNTTRTSTHCNMSCSTSHRNRPTPGDPHFISWCAHGNPIYNDTTHTKIQCVTPGCRCQYPLFRYHNTLYSCVICGTLFRSLRNALVCSQHCANVFNNLTPSQYKHLLPYVTDRLKLAGDDFQMISLIARDINPALSTTEFRSLGLSADPYDLLEHCTTVTQTTPVTTTAYHTGNRLAIQQIIFKGRCAPFENPSNREEENNEENNQNTITLYTIKTTNKSYPQNRCPYKFIRFTPRSHPREQTPIERLTISPIQYQSPPNLFTTPTDLIAQAWRVLYLSTPISLIKQNLHLFTPRLPHFTITNPGATLYLLTPEHLTTLITQITAMHGHCTPHLYNQPLYLTSKKSLEFVPPALPSYTPTTQSFSESTDVSLCIDKQPLTNLTDVYTL